MDSEVRTALADTIYSFYLSGKLDCVSKINGACLGDGLLFGKVMMKVREHKESKEGVDGVAASVSGESNAAGATPSVASDTAESKRVCEEGNCERQTESVCEGTKKVKARSRVPKTVRFSNNESRESKRKVSRHTSERNCCQRVGSLLKLW